MTDLDINSKPLYVSAYGKDGRRITSYVVGIHGDNIEAIEDKLKKEYPNSFIITQTAKEWREAIAMNLVYLDGALKECPPISEKEQRQTELNTLDRKYAGKLSNIELEMAKAKAIEDEDLYTELKEEREALINEYAEKRGEI